MWQSRAAPLQLAVHEDHITSLLLTVTAGTAYGDFNRVKPKQAGKAAVVSLPEADSTCSSHEV